MIPRYWLYFHFIVVAVIIFIGWTYYSISEKMAEKAELWQGSYIVGMCSGTPVWYRPSDKTYWYRRLYRMKGPDVCK